jgi:hypothetical protein
MSVGQWCQWHRCTGDSGVIDNAVAKVENLKVEYLRDFYAIFKKTLNPCVVEGVYEKLFDEKKSEVKNSWYGLFNVMSGKKRLDRQNLFFLQLMTVFCEQHLDVMMHFQCTVC